MPAACPPRPRCGTAPNAVVDVGDLLRSPAGNWWRVEAARKVSRRTESPYLYAWALTVSRLPGEPGPEPDPPTVHTIVRKNRARRR